MISEEFRRSQENLSTAQQAELDKVFVKWHSDASKRQIVENIQGETALETTRFTELLAEFLKQLNIGETLHSAWEKASRSHQLRGKQLPVDDCPTLLGKVSLLKSYAELVSKDSGGLLTVDQAIDLLRRKGFSDRGKSLPKIIRQSRLGEYLIWATFHDGDSSQCPFQKLPADSWGVCTALGLGHIVNSNGPVEELFLLTWDHQLTNSPPLFRPTVADAESNVYYRPVDDAGFKWGLTQPLPPNKDGLARQPEVVLSSITGVGLVFAFSPA